MGAPAAYLGLRKGAGGAARPLLFRLDVGSTDDGAAVVLLAEPSAAAPAGTQGECVFSALHLTLTWTMATTVVVVPILDGVERDAAERVSIALTAPGGGRRQTRTFEIALGFTGRRGDGTPYGRFAYRGTWFSFRLWTPSGLNEGDLIVDRAVLKGEVVRESRAAAVNAS